MVSPLNSFLKLFIYINYILKTHQADNETTKSLVSLPNQEKKEDNNPQILEFIEAKIKEKVGAEIRRLAGIMEDTAAEPRKFLNILNLPMYLKLS